MKATLNFRFVLISIGVCFCSLNMYGQWDDYLGHTDEEHHINSRSIFLRDFPSKNLDGFQILSRYHLVPIEYRPIFQINTRGRMLIGSVLSTDHIWLDFMQVNEKFGSINTSGEDFHVDAVRRLWLSSKGKTSMIVDANNANFFTNLHMTLPGLTVNPKFAIYSGVNDAPTLSSNRSDKFLRIGNDGGLALFGDSTYKEPKTVPTIGVTKGWVKIKGSLEATDSGIVTFVGVSDDRASGWMGTTSNHGLCIGSNNGSAAFVDINQRIYMGMTKARISGIRPDLKAKYRLFVAKGVLSEDYAIAPVGSWSDYVFNPSYNLRKLGDVEKFVEKNKHLPGVPSAAEVAEKGYSQHEINKVLLQKIEELMLYTIAQEKKIEKLQRKLDALNQ